MITIDYKVVVTNAKNARPAYHTTLTDTLYDPWNKPMYTRSWKLDTLEPGDQVTLTYSVEFNAYKTKPGTYRNVGRITGQRNDTTYAPMVSKIPPSEGWGDVIFAEGKVLGASTEAAPAPAACVPLLTSYLKQGPSSNAADVLKLQTFLNAQGSKLPTTGFFGPMTSVAVKSFQLKYASEILAPLGLKAPTGSIFGSTQRKINELNCGGTTVAVLSATSTPVIAGAPATPAVSPSSVPKPPAPKKPKAPAKADTPPQGGLGGWFKTLFPLVSQ